ncbi:MAG TPA: L,D-transpeptidase/peptidoglycan binding protein [Solirubrobacteraceae bacterium]|jgi:lipoprotein-anchoring transpeptidase ErfK/SrfK|nr:L,D-transpeptidase/peptidoglycan binding protein [Solirubrobacteraceae bacterium]
MSAPTIASPPPPSSPRSRGSRTDARARRPRRVPIALALALGLLALLIAAMFLYDHTRRDEIAAGVRIGGVPVGGLSEAAARAKVQRELIAPLERPVEVRSGKRVWTLGSREAGVTVDARSLVARALTASRRGSIFARTLRELTDGAVALDVPLDVRYSHAAVARLTARVRGAIERATRDARVAPSASGLSAVPSASGIAVDDARLGARVEHALAASGAGRAVSVPTHVLEPAVTTSQLAGGYPAYIVIDRAEFRLRFYERLKLAKTYEIAVGMEGLETPAGLYHVQWEQVNPPWYVPKKSWAGALAGTVVPPGPSDPLKARFMSFDGGAGIHGIDPSEYSSIGHDASHGCVRMRIPDVIALYEKSPVGTPVYII